MDTFLTCALPKGRIFFDCLELFQRIGINAPGQLNESRRLIAEDEQNKLRFLLVRATDVPTYVEYGCADLVSWARIPSWSRKRIFWNLLI